MLGSILDSQLFSMLILVLADNLLFVYLGWEVRQMGVEELHLTWSDGRTTVALRPPAHPGATARLDDLSIHVLDVGAADAADAIRSLFAELADGSYNFV